MIIYKQEYSLVKYCLCISNNLETEYNGLLYLSKQRVRMEAGCRKKESVRGFYAGTEYNIIVIYRPVLYLVTCQLKMLCRY